MKKSSVALLVLIPLFVFTFGGILGSSFEEVQAYFARPFPAIIAALTLIVPNNAGTKLFAISGHVITSRVAEDAMPIIFDALIERHCG